LDTVVSNILLAADGYGLTVSRSDNLSKGHYSIHLKFLFPEKKDTSNNKLLDSIIERHTNRSKFTKELPPAEFLEKINDISSSLSVDARIITDESVKSQMVQIFGESVEASLSDKNFVSELSQWIKSSLSKHKDGMPGYSIGIPWLFSFIMPSLIKTGKIGGLLRKADEQVWTASPLFVVLSSKDDLSSWVKVGEVFERLAVAAQGVNFPWQNPSFNDAIIDENWNIIVNMRKLLVESGLEYHIDLTNEATPAANQPETYRAHIFCV
jgi:hypothetical protein